MLQTGPTWTSAENAEQTFKISDYEPERRQHRRSRVRMRAEARRMDNTLCAQRSPKFAITVLDISEGGIAATTRQPVEDGERLLITMPPEAGVTRRIFGRVIRCSARKDGWHLAIKFDFVPAA
jgi:hypothetical protein